VVGVSSVRDRIVARYTLEKVEEWMRLDAAYVPRYAAIRRGSTSS
jgi:hypothetical protein